MAFDIEGAKKAGYSDQEIESYLSKKQATSEKPFDVEGAKKAGYSDKEIEQYLAKKQPKQPEKPKLQEPATLKGSAQAFGSGFGGGVGGAIPDLLKLIEPFASVSPTAGATTQLSKLTGLKGTHELTSELAPQEPQNALERILQQSGQFGGQEALAGTAIGGPVGGAVGTAHGAASGALYGGLKEAGLPDEWALGLTALTTLSPIAAQKLWPKLVSKFKSGIPFQEAAKEVLPQGLKIGEEAAAAPKVRLADMMNTPRPKPQPKEIDRLPSGLAKPRAMEAKNTHLATINPERQKYAIKQLDKEATELANKSVAKHLPLAEEIKAGKDFQGHFDKEFDSLATMAKKHNPDIDITPISDLLRETRSKYRGIPSPHKDVVKIKKEIERFSDNPQTRMYNLLKIYRSNNKKQRDIFETSRLTGKQQEYSDFLSSFNRAISKSFGETLPEDSQWLSRFLKNNKDYKKYIDTKTSMRLLEPLLEGQVSSARINTLAKDPRLHKKLELSMGKQGADEIIQISKDLKAARDSIKNLPKEKVHAFDAVFPIGFLIPFVKIPLAIMKGAKFSRSLYGYWLSSPATRHAVEDATKALAKGDVAAYTTATKTLQKDIPN